MAYEAVDTASLVSHYVDVRKRLLNLKPYPQTKTEQTKPPAITKAPSPAPAVESVKAPITIPKIEDIILAVLQVYPVTRLEFSSRRRQARVVLPRQVATYLAHVMTQHSSVIIGKLIGEFDHTTVLHSIRKIEDRIARNPVFAAVIDTIREQILARLRPPEDISVVVQ